MQPAYMGHTVPQTMGQRPTTLNSTALEPHRDSWLGRAKLPGVRPTTPPGNPNKKPQALALRLKLKAKINLILAKRPRSDPILFQALKLVKKGGAVVYSTCSLNPAQNDGVVQMALRKVWEETSMKIVVKDLSQALEPAKVVFKFAEPRCLKYGSLIVPYLPSNFGPMYFCKLEKEE
ncbi:5-methylcytosine rRNA methyltransferase nsun4 [Homalodisca vitripennis]|nr:5-methylcytosine rRNA methyltransferase nsun4 [Homalodisca vitripennis]